MSENSLIKIIKPSKLKKDLKNLKGSLKNQEKQKSTILRTSVNDEEKEIENCENWIFLVNIDFSENLN